MSYRKILLWPLLCYWSTVWAENLIENSSFEAGIDSRIAIGRWYINGLPSTVQDEETRVHGQYSLRLPLSRLGYTVSPRTVNGTELRSWQTIELEAGKTYTFSAYVRSDKPLNGQIILSSSSPSSKKKDILADKSVEITSKWGRIYLSYKPKIRENVYWVIQAQSNKPGHLWVDALQLEEGRWVTDYQPSSLVEASITSDRPGKIYTSGETPVIDLRVFNEGSQDRSVMSFNLGVYDLAGNRVHNQELTQSLPISSGAHLQITLPTLKNGIYRCELTETGSGSLAGELHFSILPKPRVVLPADGAFGAYTTIAPEALTVMRRLGFTWIANLTSNGRTIYWNQVEPMTGRFIWYDDDVAMAREAGFELMFNLEPCKTPAWARNLPRSERLEKWRNYVSKMVEHYGAVVKFWTIADEAHETGERHNKKECWVNAAEYAGWHSAGYKAIKAADPGANVIMNTTAKFARDVFKHMPASRVDVLAVNGYHVSPFLRRVKSVANEYGIKRLWAPGISIPNLPYYRFHNSAAKLAMIDDDYWLDRSRELAIAVITTLGMGYEKLFHYTATYVGNTNRYSLFEADSGLKPIGAQFGALAWLLDGVEHASKLDVGLASKGVNVYRLDRKDGQTVFPVWGAAVPDQQLALQEISGYTPAVYDTFANRIPVKHQGSEIFFTLDQIPVFIMVPHDRADDLQQALIALSLYKQ